MHIARITVTPQPNGTTEIRLQGTDDTGRVLDSWTTSAVGVPAKIALAQAVRSLQSLASNFTEEEGFPQKAS